MTTSSHHPKIVHRRYASRRIPEAAADLRAATASGGMAVARRRLEDG